jgi:hypothetical protein
VRHCGGRTGRGPTRNLVHLHIVATRLCEQRCWRVALAASRVRWCAATRSPVWSVGLDAAELAAKWSVRREADLVLSASRTVADGGLDAASRRIRRVVFPDADDRPAGATAQADRAWAWSQALLIAPESSGACSGLPGRAGLVIRQPPHEWGTGLPAGSRGWRDPVAKIDASARR